MKKGVLLVDRSQCDLNLPTTLISSSNIKDITLYKNIIYKKINRFDVWDLTPYETTIYLNDSFNGWEDKDIEIYNNSILFRKNELSRIFLKLCINIDTHYDWFSVIYKINNYSMNNVFNIALNEMGASKLSPWLKYHV